MENEFREKINSLHKEFFEVIKQRYKVKRLIVKMLCEKGLYRGMSDADLAFRTCKVNRFSDKHINKLYNKDIEKAINLLRARGVACLHVTSAINDMVISSVSVNYEYLKFVESLKHLSNEIYSLAKQSISLSDKWAIQCDLPTFKEKQFDIDEYLNSINENNTKGRA